MHGNNTYFPNDVLDIIMGYFDDDYSSGVTMYAYESDEKIKKYQELKTYQDFSRGSLYGRFVVNSPYLYFILLDWNGNIYRNKDVVFEVDGHKRSGTELNDICRVIANIKIPSIPIYCISRDTRTMKIVDKLPYTMTMIWY
ncbi:MAG: hypothetical protein P1U70_23005 [Saprospiraceae bacterium]|nr:hypothetical protein [Saprospiraceae bacterium]